MKISVIVLTYNHEKHIAQALDSLLVQETNFCRSKAHFRSRGHLGTEFCRLLHADVSERCTRDHSRMVLRPALRRLVSLHFMRATWQDRIHRRDPWSIQDSQWRIVVEARRYSKTGRADCVL